MSDVENNLKSKNYELGKNPQFYVISSTGFSGTGKDLVRMNPNIRLKPSKSTSRVGSAQQPQKSGSVLPIFAILIGLVVLITWLQYSHETYVMEHDDFLRNFKLLQLPETATKEEVEKQFRKLARDMYFSSFFL